MGRLILHLFSFEQSGGSASFACGRRTQTGFTPLFPESPEKCALFRASNWNLAAVPAWLSSTIKISDVGFIVSIHLHCFDTGVIGRVNWKTDPPPGWESAQIRPPCCSMIFLQMESPIP